MEKNSLSLEPIEENSDSALGVTKESAKLNLELILQEQRSYGEAHKVPILREEEVPLFLELVQKYKPSSVLEVGTAIGYSTLLIASGLSLDGKLLSLELDKARHEKAKAYIGKTTYASRIHCALGDANELLKTLEGTFDFVFLDGPKGHYLEQLKLIMPHLRPGAVVLADNVLFRGYVRGEVPCPRRFKTITSRLKAYLDFVEGSPSFDTEIIPLGDGMSVSIWKG